MDSKSLGFLKYEVEHIENGIFDARKSAQALFGFDEIMKYFIRKESPELAGIDFYLPVKINKGSWEISIPDNIAEIVKLVGATTLVSAYLINMAKKAATDGFFETGIVKDVKKIFQYALKVAQWCIKIKKHLKNKKIIERIDNNSDSVNLDVDNERLSVPIEIYIIYKQMPENIFSKVSSVIDDNTEMIWAVKNEENNEFIEEKVTISQKELFYTDKDDYSEILFPEMLDGETVELQGEITRNNNKSNTIGFEYRGHILTCIPNNKVSLTTYKDKIISKSEDRFFTTATIIGIVDRSESNGLRPKIKFTDIIPTESRVIIQQKLF